ncbi:MAG: PAS domain S-box protein [Acidobacteriota bacterium]|nr:PAS domain S-box protein [Acidobacteriota bacterium]
MHVSLQGRDAHVHMAGYGSTKRKQHQVVFGEHAYLNMLARAADPILIHLDGEICFANEAAAGLLGASLAVELIGMHVLKFIHPDNHEVTRKRIADILNSQRPSKPFGQMVLRLDGDPIEVEVVGTPLEFDGRKAVQVLFRHPVTYAGDVEIQERLKGILEAGTDVVLMADEDGRIVYMNRQARKISGKGPDEEILDVMLSDFYPPEVDKRIREEGISEAKRRGSWSTEAELMCANGNRLPCDQVLLAQRSPHGYYFSVVARDISDRIRREREINRLNQQLKGDVIERTDQLRQAQKELLEKAHKAGMAHIATSILHNVGNLLNSVITSSEELCQTVETSRILSISRGNRLLRRHWDDIEGFMTRDPRGKRLLNLYLAVEDAVLDEHETMLENARNMIQKIGLIRNVVRAQQNYADGGKQEESVSLREVVEDSLMIEENNLIAANIRVERHYSEVPEVWGRRIHLVHVLVNLFKNARESIEEANPKLRQVTVNIRMEENRACILVSDTGTGIPPENLTVIFQHGYTTKQGSNGFGLHGCANTIKELGGRIQAHSEGSGRGAVMRIEFGPECFNKIGWTDPAAKARETPNLGRSDR